MGFWRDLCNDLKRCRNARERERKERNKLEVTVKLEERTPPFPKALD